MRLPKEARSEDWKWNGRTASNRQMLVLAVFKFAAVRIGTYFVFSSLSLKLLTFMTLISVGIVLLRQRDRVREEDTRGERI